MNKSRKQLATAVAVVAAGMAPSGFAQTLEEVIVTAQKRAESVQDIPIAVSAYSGDDLRAMDAKGFEAIILRTPGLSGSADSDTQNVLTIRGIGSAVFSPGADNSVGTYFNEVPLSRNVGGMGYLDVERIEVVKGPQGTLFGRNTSSGAISITNQWAEVGDNSLSLRGAWGDESQQMYEGIGNWSPTDKLALRVAARHDERDGTYENAVTGDELNGRDHDQIRAGLTWDITDSFTANWFYENFQMENRWQMVDSLGIWGNDAFSDSVRVNNQPKQEIDADFSVLRLNWDLNESMSLTSNTGYYDSDIVALPTDADAGDVPIADFVEPWTIEQVTQEFRLNVEWERVSWFVGGSYFNEEVSATTFLTVYEDPGLDVLFEDEGLCLVAEEFGLECGIHQEAGAATNETTSYALYGDVVVDLTDRLQLTLGARYTDEEKEMSINNPLVDSTTTALIGAVTGTPDNVVFHYTSGEVDDKKSWTSFDPRVALDYALSDDTLLYANYASGFKSGGFNRQPTVAGGTDILDFDPEENDAYEIGIKTDFWDQRARLNVALFYYDYGDFQVETNQNATILIQNVSEVENQGHRGRRHPAAGRELRHPPGLRLPRRGIQEGQPGGRRGQPHSPGRQPGHPLPRAHLQHRGHLADPGHTGPAGRVRLHRRDVLHPRQPGGTQDGRLRPDQCAAGLQQQQWSLGRIPDWRQPRGRGVHQLPDRFPAAHRAARLRPQCPPGGALQLLLGQSLSQGGGNAPPHFRAR